MTRSRLKSGEASEESIHRALMEWVSINPLTKQFKDFFIHCPNEGKRSYSYARRLNAIGMRKGVADIFIAVPRRGYGGCWIELKSKKGKLNPDQERFLKDMSSHNYSTYVCYSFEEAVKTISWYFQLDI
jgi:hypothetical protein